MSNTTVVSLFLHEDEAYENSESTTEEHAYLRNTKSNNRKLICQNEKKTE
jgi:riboflavin synthase